MPINIDEEDEITSGGYRIYPYEMIERDNIFYFNKTIGKSFVDTTENINVAKTTLNNFGRFPYVYKVGNMNYKTFDLNGLFIANIEKGLSAKDNVDIFVSLVNKNKPFVIENPLGETILADITISSISNPLLYQENGVEYIIVNINCVEIGVVN